MKEIEFANFKKELEDAGVTLVAVSKKKSVEDILKVYHYGHRDFGENYVQELVEKQKLLPADIHWHFVGHLQRNKVKEIAGFVHLIHGVDSERLIKEINKQAIKNNRTIDVLLQVHIAEEATKFGLSADEVRQILSVTDLYPNVRVRGLMGMGTLTDNEEQTNREFHQLRQLFDDCGAQLDSPNWSILSMGMSGDYLTAIKNGSTMVRVGTLIFGERVY